MAASLVKKIMSFSISGISGGPGGSSILSNNTVGLLTSVRNASKKSGGSSRNKKGRARGKRRGIKKADGLWVSQGTILVRQLGLDYLPGLNVGIGRDRTLFAIEHGRVMMTTEKVNPNWDHSFVRRFYADLQNQEDVPIYKTYFHILTDPQKQNFKLVDQI
ncbi:39S ribosomal protein L27, mitochondrial-like [Homarus americanus]|uniref:Large ribosomal subunit protein bL27m n=1 Tax=Homarus americanus TaxID=6706 RepID=A0A8J5JE96_HOMAM|nr:39S ribosomal protein L27, mitochondrial-like [Homarus americanus]KAG7155021.1 39S ribosomal protein L27-like [Homarus americanus]